MKEWLVITAVAYGPPQTILCTVVTTPEKSWAVCINNGREISIAQKLSYLENLLLDYVQYD